MDLQKAFDSVDRVLLLRSLVDKGIDQELVNAIASLLKETYLKVGNEYVNNSIGVPQGSRLSPILFVLFINDLVDSLNSNGNTCLAFADDLVVHAPKHTSLAMACDALKEWSTTTGIEVNTKKSAILKIKADGRTPGERVKSFKGFPIVQEYKYLGIIISDCLSFKVHNKKIKSVLHKFRMVMWNKKRRQLPPVINHHSWTTLILSQISYGTFLLTSISAKVRAHFLKFLYDSYKILLNLKGKLSVNKLVETVSGRDTEVILEGEEKNAKAIAEG